jgi:RNA polymerase sigma-70 factor (ECF subfamily)
VEPGVRQERDEIALMQAVADGDKAAARLLVTEYFPYVHGYVRAQCAGNQMMVEDVMQEVFVEVHKYAGTFRGASSLATWLCTIARRRLFKAFERERRQAAVAERMQPGGGGAEQNRPGVRRLRSVPDDELEIVIDIRDETLTALSTLPPDYRQALTMKYLDDCSVQEVAAALGRTKVQTQSLLQRARVMFGKELGRGRE